MRASSRITAPSPSSAWSAALCTRWTRKWRSPISRGWRRSTSASWTASSPHAEGAMLTLAEIGPAIFGTWRLAHFDPDGLRYFDRSIRGFWRSFRVAVLVAPLWFAPIALAPVHLSDGWFRFTVAELIGYA